LVLLISAISKSSLIPFFMGGLVFATPILLHGKFQVDIAWMNSIMELSYTEVMKVRNIFTGFKVYNFFGTPILYLYVALLTMAVLFLATCYLTYYTFRNHQIKG
jgi:hypothetical protein